MGGDNVITFELSNRLAENLSDQRFEELASRLNADEQYLSAEWVSTLFRLRDEELEEKKVLLSPDVFVYAAIESSRMRQIDFLDGSNLDELSDHTLKALNTQVMNMYYAHSGVHSMLHRQDRLAVGAQIFERNIDRKKRPDTFMFRQTGNMYEELAFYDMLKGQSTANLEKARGYNEYVVDTVPSWHYAYKIHALYSLFDLEADKTLSKRLQGEPQSHQELKNIHIGFNYALDFISEKVKNYSAEWGSIIKELDDEDARLIEDKMSSYLYDMSGVLAEGVALSDVQGYILEHGLHNRYWARQSFLREDSTGTRRLADPNDEEKQISLKLPNMSFDLQIYDYTDPEGERIPIEVKKRNNPSAENLHPDIKVIKLNNSNAPTAFAKFVQKYARGQIKKCSSERRRGKEQAAASRVRERVDAARFFAKAA